jgi:CRP-like cAMP-binding protein
MLFDIAVDQGDILAVRGVGEYFGEAALKDNKPRMATIVATGEVECARMDR